MKSARKPVIGINAEYRPARKDVSPLSYLHAGYYDSVVAAGGVPIVIPPLTQEADLLRILDLIDGLVLIGATGDLDPKRQGQIPHASVRIMAPRREDSDRLLCRLGIDRRIPLLGIAAGMQLVNVLAGGSLHQHIPEDLPKAMPHRDPLEGIHRHALVIEPRTRIEAVYGDGEIRVNSNHHQAINKVAPGFIVSATAPDGVVECIESIADDWFCMGVQWHPESESASALDLQVFEALITAAAPAPQLSVRKSA